MSPATAAADRKDAPAASDDFVAKALADKLTGADVFRVTLTAFLDAHTFDTRRVMKCCLAHVLPSGHVVPFCAYNTLYRDGHVSLPPLVDQTHATNLSLPLVSDGLPSVHREAQAVRTEARLIG